MEKISASHYLSGLVIVSIFSATVSAVYSIILDNSLQFRPYDDLRISPLGRLLNPVIGATAYGFAALFSLHCSLQSQDSLKQIGWLLLMVLLLYTVHLTGSIAVWPALLLSGLLALGLRRGMRMKKVILLMTGVAAICGLVFATSYFLYPEFPLRLIPRTTSFRPDIWRVVIDIVVDKNPWVGLGLLDTGHLTVGELEYQHAHSIYFAGFCHGGLIGIALLAAVIVRGLRVVISASFPQESGGQTLNSNSSQLNPQVCSAAATRALPNLALVTLLYACVVFALDGDGVWHKIDLTWIVFWIPISLCVLIDTQSETRSAGSDVSC
jgi:O-antigen ligase|tara:strand:- start:805 stop:1776 length:972 start_codon:yes stop_codon:yes gene_type:complete